MPTNKKTINRTIHIVRDGQPIDPSDIVSAICFYIRNKDIYFDLNLRSKIYFTLKKFLTIFDLRSKIKII